MKFFALLLTFSLATIAQNSVTVTINGIKKAKGDIRVQLISSKENYTATPSIALDSLVKSAAKPSTTLQFLNVADGEYAIKVFQDLDYDRKLNTNMFGIPKEPYGFSNSARGKMGPPSYEQVLFQVTGNTVQTITIK